MIESMHSNIWNARWAICRTCGKERRLFGLGLVVSHNRWLPDEDEPAGGFMTQCQGSMKPARKVCP